MAAVIDLDEYTDGVLAANRAFLGRAITLVESTLPDHQQLARDLLLRLLPHAGGAHRIGITGVPGAGKSTFIDALGTDLTAAGHRVAELAVDPSSKRTGGSILGDKTRMAQLAIDDNAFIRPSPSAGVLGGVTRATRESLVIVEAAGFDVVFVETVGVGQSETTVANMVDTFLLLMLARTGDGLQGIKKGVLELADVIAVNKADGAHVIEAKAAASELVMAMHLMEPADPGWTAPVVTCSAVERTGLDFVWGQLAQHRAHLERTEMDGTTRLASKRSRQDVAWMWATVEDQLLSRFRSAPDVRAVVSSLEASVRAGTTTPTLAAEQLLDLARRRDLAPN
jgi:LAO/AO transport system kinase